LIEKEFLSFGHQFALRTGHDGSGKLNERSPVFLQFLECVFQLIGQFPCEFEFNERFLLTLLDECYSNRFGTFLHDCEKERIDARVKETTNSLWSYINSNIQDYRNPLFKYCNYVLFPETSQKRMKIWENYYLRQMNFHLKQTSPIEDRVNEIIQEYQQKLRQLQT